MEIENTKGLTFRQAYDFMLRGEKVKRPMMKGYFFIDSLDGKLTIYTKDKKTLKRVDFQTTAMNMLATDWEVID